ncbi:MAG: hypothetical protein B7X04_02130 [Parcubacteria group bacterium 21-54-25]|nr:MAG: hypothetical protein B7X04_02130 [Parcubacteria group bacterium 21-54-25]HQU07845.1 carboxypeptidase-like regulatory domain-containing protein [Candidatus Paceibacterota bacterium]
MQHQYRGMGLIDVIVGSALVLIVFLALMGVLRASILLSALAKANAGATSLADSQMEYLRGLTYDNLGTVGGIPAGPVPQATTTVMDSTAYTIQTYIQYIDDPADGLGVNDTNGITTDYKVAKVTVSYFAAGQPRSAVLVSNFAPPGIETTGGGGTLQINVVNANGAAVPGATVHIVNTSTAPTVDLSTFSNAAGTVYLPGAATSTNYQVAVTKAGYSNAQTYTRTTTNQNPSPGYLTVVKDQTTTGTFAIDYLASLTMRTYSPPTPGTFLDTFNDESLLAATTSIDAVGGALQLSGSALSGTARSVAVSPSNLDTWGNLSAGLSVPSGASVLLHIYDGSGVLLPDSVLSGNATGFSSFPVDLSGISTSTYPTLAIGADMTTPNTTTVPQILEWSLGYTTGPTPLPNVPFTLTGTKTIGSTGSGVPIYKTIVATTTNAMGARTLSLEWDAYGLSNVTGYDIEDACPAPPYSLAPGSTNAATLTLVPGTANRLYVLVQDANGNSVSGATVSLSRTGYTSTHTTSACAGAYFGNLSAASDYEIDISKSGYTNATFTGVSVSGQTFYTATFP